MVLAHESPHGDRHRSTLTRRRFIASTGAAALSFEVIKPRLVRAYTENAKIDLGMVGCGGRGTWIAGLFKEHGGYNIVAAADYFRNRVDDFGNKWGIQEASRYAGRKGHLRLLEKVDAVAIESPAYFHPEHIAAAIGAGKHVYTAKPIAVDVPGCLAVRESGRKATSQKLCFIVDFQTRADPFFIEAIKRVHEGAIGRFAFGESSYHQYDPFTALVDMLGKRHRITRHLFLRSAENRLLTWYLHKTLTGDLITERDIHALDVMNWIMNKPPLWAVGTCARKVRPIGTCCDTFSVFFQYSDDVGITFSSRQFNGHGTVPDGIRNRVFGDKGVLETKSGGQVLIRGEHFYRGGSSPSIGNDAVVTNIATFYDSIVGGKFDNPTVEPSVQSNLVAILGRMAAYRRRKVTWQEVMECEERLDPDLKGLKA